MKSLATEAHSWQRRHIGGAIALAIWLNGRCEASVYEAPGLSQVRDRVVCDTAGEAKTRADRLLRDAYPHDCKAAGCDLWVTFARTSRVCGCY